MIEYTNLISAADLSAIAQDCVILDCRSQLGDPEWGRGQYEQGHIQGALYVHLDSDLADPPSAHGRHPLPDPTVFADRVGAWGIGNNTQVVCYDDAGGAYAARAWWMLRWLGHAKVAILNGGLQTWSEPLEAGEAPTPRPVHFTQQAALTKLISADELQAQLSNPSGGVLVDARARSRWSGEAEPIDPVAGHIPGAHCYPFHDNLRDDGLFRSATELRTRFNTSGAPVICYCGSGVTATHNLLAMHVAGLPEGTLFADSWSGWITDSSRPVETTH